MNFIGKHLNLLGIFLLTIFGAAAATLYFDVPARLQNSKPKSKPISAAEYACPMHPEVTSASADDCPKCGMALVSALTAKTSLTPGGHEQCATNMKHESGCCAKETTSGCARNFELPPGHPPIDGSRPGNTVSPPTNPAH
jgi:hypothetical protein